MQPMKPFTLVSGGLSGLPEIPIVPAKEGQPNPGAPFLAKIDRGSEIFLYGNAKQLMKGIWHTLRGLLGAVGEYPWWALRSLQDSANQKFIL